MTPFMVGAPGPACRCRIGDHMPPAAANFLEQQARLDTFLDRFNHERPHQVLADASARRPLRDLDTPVSRPHRPRLPLSRLINDECHYGGQRPGMWLHLQAGRALRRVRTPLPRWLPTSDRHLFSNRPLADARHTSIVKLTHYPELRSLGLPARSHLLEIVIRKNLKRPASATT